EGRHDGHRTHNKNNPPQPPLSLDHLMSSALVATSNGGWCAPVISLQTGGSDVHGHSKGGGGVAGGGRRPSPIAVRGYAILPRGNLGWQHHQHHQHHQQGALPKVVSHPPAGSDAAATPMPPDRATYEGGNLGAEREGGGRSWVFTAAEAVRLESEATDTPPPELLTMEGLGDLLEKRLREEWGVP
ncbi:unnamed protein product, partial [Discosporangium mesarthrocarpum]